MTIKLGETQVSMMNPPLDGEVDDGGKVWKIGHGQYGIVLRANGECHPDFINGMDLASFCWWINSKLQ